MTILIDDLTPDDFSWHWSISDLTMLRGYRGLTNIVTTVHMGLTGVWTDPEAQVWLGGQTFTVDVTFPNIDAISAETYTEVADLTEQQVMGWCMARLTDDQIANAKQMCVEDVKYRRTWTFSPPPWVKVDPTPEEPKA
jgi:hypothetical protein